MMKVQGDFSKLSSEFLSKLSVDLERMLKDSGLNEVGSLKVSTLLKKLDQVVDERYEYEEHNYEWLR